MQVMVRVVPRAKRRGIEPQGDGSLCVRVTAPAQDGRANAAVLELVAEHFGVPKRAVTIRRGGAARVKLLDIAEG